MEPSDPAAIRFHDLSLGMKAKVVAVLREDPSTHRLVEMGLTPGAEFQLIKIAPLGDPVEILLRGYRLCLRKSEFEAFALESLGR